MAKKLIAIALAVSAFASAPRSNAGTEVVRDYGGGEVNNYAPPPRPVYYAPPPVVVYPAVSFYTPFHVFGPRFRVVAVRRFDGRRFHSQFHRWH